MLPKIEMTRYRKSPKVLPMVESTVRYPDFAERLTSAMSKSGLDITDIKNELSVTYEMARRYVMGAAMPRPARLKKLAAVIGCEPAWLLYGDGAANTAVSSDDGERLARTKAATSLKRSTTDRIAALTPTQRRKLDDMIDAVLRGFEADK